MKRLLIGVTHARSFYKALSWEYRCLIGAGALSILPILAMTFASKVTPSDSSPAIETRAAAVDTFIPRGFVLVPIEVQNYEALDSILGRFGIVDLLLPAAAETGRAKLVARNVRLLRAPQNPSHFAVLIREKDVDQILRFGVTFSVVIKRPGQDGTEFVTSNKPKHRTIIYDGSP